MKQTSLFLKDYIKLNYTALAIKPLHKRTILNFKWIDTVQVSIN